MKTPLAVTMLFALAVIAAAQQQVGVTDQNSSRLGPDATQKEVRDWVSAQTIEAAVQAATEHTKLSGAQIHFFKVCAVAGKSVDQLVLKHPELKAEAEALYTQWEPKVQEAVAGFTKFGAQPLQAQIIRDLLVRFSIFDEITKKHADLAPEANALFQQRAGHID